MEGEGGDSMESCRESIFTQPSVVLSVGVHDNSSNSQTLSIKKLLANVRSRFEGEDQGQELVKLRCPSGFCHFSGDIWRLNSLDDPPKVPLLSGYRPFGRRYTFSFQNVGIHRYFAVSTYVKTESSDWSVIENFTNNISQHQKVVTLTVENQSNDGVQHFFNFFCNYKFQSGYI